MTEELAGIEELTKVSDAKTLQEAIDQSAADLEMLIDIVSNLEIDDATQRTAIIDNISNIFSTVNQARAALKKKSRDLMSVEGVAEFNSQLKLLDQSIVNYLDVCDSPEKCDEFLTKVMIGIEELEGRFAEFDEFVVQLSEKRDEVYNAFESRKLQLVEARNKRANALMSAAERILGGIQSRVGTLESVNDINGYFASDLMIDKVRDIVDQLKELEDSVKVDDIQSRLKTIREDAVRQLKDRQDLFVGGDNVIKMGNHHFSVNVQQLDLTTVFRDDEMALHLTGTDFFEPIGDEEFLATRELWRQDIVSETAEVYRGEYLAYRLFEALGSEELPERDEVLAMEPDARLAVVQEFMGPRYAESYVKGVHDRDSSQILGALLQMNARIGLLRYHPRSRAMAKVFWSRFGDKPAKDRIAAQLRGFGSVSLAFPGTGAQAAYVASLTGMLEQFVTDEGLFNNNLVGEAAEYLFAELADPDTGCTIRAPRTSRVPGTTAGSPRAWPRSRKTRPADSTWPGTGSRPFSRAVPTPRRPTTSTRWRPCCWRDRSIATSSSTRRPSPNSTTSPSITPSSTAATTTCSTTASCRGWHTSTRIACRGSWPTRSRRKNWSKRRGRECDSRSSGPAS